MILKPDSVRDVLIHIGLALGLLAALVLLFFYVYLPRTTHHGESITVPDLRGQHVDKLEMLLDQMNLRFEVMPDSGFSSELPPLAVISQYPKEGSKVKENRKIYVSLNAQQAPLVKMPQLIDASVRSAEMTLNSYGLVLGKIKYVPHVFQNAVLKQLSEGKEIPAGEQIPKGSVIDLVAGDGLGSAFEAPDIVGKVIEEARFIIEGSGLEVGSILYIKSVDQSPGVILKQNPTAGRRVQAGELIDIWVSTQEVDTQDIEGGDNTE